MLPLETIASRESPRSLLAAHFKSVGGELPIHGGWGYTQADACIIDKNDPVVDLTVPFDGVALEYEFVKYRIYEEMFILRPVGEKYFGIKWNLCKQHLVQDGGKSFDRLIFDVAAIRNDDWEELNAEFAGPRGHGSPGFDDEAHERKRQEKMVRVTREFWFDITSFFGQGVIASTDKSTGEKKYLQADSFYGNYICETLGIGKTKRKISVRLRDELLEFASSTVRYGGIPKSHLTVVKSDGSQFVFQIGLLELSRPQKLDLIRYLLYVEKAVAYAHSVGVGVHVGGDVGIIKRISVTSADLSSYASGALTLDKRDEGGMNFKILWPTEASPSLPYHNLLDGKFVRKRSVWQLLMRTGKEESEWKEEWSRLRVGVHWLRGAE